MALPLKRKLTKTNVKVLKEVRAPVGRTVSKRIGTIN